MRNNERKKFGTCPNAPFISEEISGYTHESLPGNSETARGISELPELTPERASLDLLWVAPRDKAHPQNSLADCPKKDYVGSFITLGGSDLNKYFRTL